MAQEEIKTGDYANFDAAQEKVGTLNKKLENHQKSISDSKTKLSDANIFAGPICDSCIDEVTKLGQGMTSIISTFTSIKDYIATARANYEKGDKDAIAYLDIKGDGIVTPSATNGNQSLVNSLTGELGKRSGDYGDSAVKFHNGEWCADFVSYMLKKNGYNYRWATLAGANDPTTIFGVMKEHGDTVHYDQYSATQGKKPDSSYVAQPGDVFLMNIGDKKVSYHTGFVVKDNGDGTVTTIEGNTFKEGQSYDGKGIVEQHVRSKKDIYGYISPTMDT